MGPVVIPITDEIDLHTFRPAEVSEVLSAYFEACRERGLFDVRVIHGKGSGRLRDGVYFFLDRSPDVAAWRPAPPDRGGWGACLVQLRGLDG